MNKIVHLLLGLIALIVLFFGIKFYLQKKKEQTIQKNDRMIEEKEDKL